MLPYMIHRTTGLPLHETAVWHLPDRQAVPGIWRSMGRRVPDEPNTNTWSDSCGSGVVSGASWPIVLTRCAVRVIIKRLVAHRHTAAQ